MLSPLPVCLMTELTTVEAVQFVKIGGWTDGGMGGERKEGRKEDMGMDGVMNELIN